VLDSFLKEISENYYIDAHMHLDLLPQDEIRGTIIRAREKNIAFGILAGINLESFLNLFDFFKNFQEEIIFISKNSYAKDMLWVLENKKRMGVFLSIGNHPSYLKQEESWEEFEKILFEKRDILWALGETGYDLRPSCLKSWGLLKEEALLVQEKVFEKMCLLGKKYTLPLILHSCRAFEKTFAMIQKYPLFFMFHAFYGSEEQFSLLKKQKVLISLGGAITGKNSPKVQKFLPFFQERKDLSSCCLETDSPDMPLFWENKFFERTYPENIHEISLFLSQYTSIPQKEILSQTSYQTFLWLFKVSIIGKE